MQYNSIDAFKLFFAICVVGIHTSDVCPTEFPLAVNMLIQMAVPFFFVTSGFLLAKKLKKHSEQDSVCWKSFRKYLRLYAIYLIIYLPIAIAKYALNDAPFYKDAASYIYGILKFGEPPYGWPLWFLWALTLGMATIGFALRRKIPLGRLWVFCMCILALDYITTHTDYLLAGENHWLSVYSRIMPVRYFSGLALLLTGVMAERISQHRHSWLAGMLLLSLAIGLQLSDWSLFVPVAAGAGVFLLILNVRLTNNPLYHKLRTISTISYFFHMYFIVLLRNLVQFQYCALTRYEAWAIASVAVIAFSILFDKLRKKPSFQWLNSLI